MINKLMNRNGANLMARKKRLFQTAKSTVEITVDGVKSVVNRKNAPYHKHYKIIQTKKGLTIIHDSE